MANDIFTSVKGLTSPENAVAPQRPASSPSEQFRRARLERTQQEEADTQDALAFFRGKRLLGGNLLSGGGKAVDPFVTRSLFSSVQRDEDDSFALLLQQSYERIAKNQFLPSPFNRVSAKERVLRLLENAPPSEESPLFPYIPYNPNAGENRQRELQAHNNAILQESRKRVAELLQEGELPDARQRPRIANLLSPTLAGTKQDRSIDLLLSPRLAQLDLDGNTPATNLVLDSLLRRRRPSSFVGLTTPAEIEAKQQELGLTDEQVEIEQKKDIEGVPTHVQVTLLGRNLDLNPRFVAAQKRIDPSFDPENHEPPKGNLVLDGAVLPSRTQRGAVIHHTLTYEEYQRLEYEPPPTGSEDQIDYFSTIAFRHPDGSQAPLDDKAKRSGLQTVALTTPETPPPPSQETRNGEVYDRFDITLPTEHRGYFQRVELDFEDTIFNTPSNILEALQNGDLLIEAKHRGQNRSYTDGRELALDLSDIVTDNDNRVRLRFPSSQRASNGIDLTLYVRQQGTPLVLEGVRAKFLPY